MLSEESRKARARLATAVAAAQREGRDEEADELIRERRRDYRYHAATDYIRQVVDSAPPLTDDQRRHLARLLTDGGGS